MIVDDTAEDVCETTDAEDETGEEEEGSGSPSPTPAAEEEVSALPDSAADSSADENASPVIAAADEELLTTPGADENRADLLVAGLLVDS